MKRRPRQAPRHCPERRAGGMEPDFTGVISHNAVSGPCAEQTRVGRWFAAIRVEPCRARRQAGKGAEQS